MQSYGEVSSGGLLQYGYSKHHADLPQFKVKLATLDNALNHFAYPITHLTVSGNKSDDELYVDLIKQIKVVLAGIPNYSTGNLYVGDSKFGALASRAYVVKLADYYLMPLSLVQLSKAEYQQAILEPIQKKILKLLFAEEPIYNQIPENIQIFFLEKKISET